ncbi:MAG: carboxypeptidase-like regulatory domain-containing protein [Ferruginibacter sp.]
MKFLFCLLLCFVSFPLFSQVIIKGKITDAATGRALQSVSVFINNSSIGTSTNERGEFSVTSPGSQRFDLVCSFVGYETQTTAVSPDNASHFFEIKLTQKSAELEQIIVQSYEKDGWAKWGKVFTEYLLGTSPSATQCKIKNSKVVRFVYDKKKQILTAYTSEPLEIENKYLGYNLVYDLQSFSYDYKNGYFYFAGYPFFKNIRGNDHKIKKWQKHRQYAYEGSIMHFMRSFYANTLEQNGFTMNVLQRFANKEKKRIKTLYKERSYRSGNQIILPYPDSASYYSNILSQSDSLDYLHKNPISSDSVAYAYDSTTAVMEFKDHLQITYSKKKEMPSSKSSTDYVLAMPVSIISMVGKPYIFIYSDGSFNEPNNILSEGYWAWSEKLSNLLPTDYKE